MMTMITLAAENSSATIVKRKFRYLLYSLYLITSTYIRSSGVLRKENEFLRCGVCTHRSYMFPYNTLCYTKVCNIILCKAATLKKIAIIYWIIQVNQHPQMKWKRSRLTSPQNAKKAYISWPCYSMPYFPDFMHSFYFPYFLISQYFSWRTKNYENK